MNQQEIEIKLNKLKELEVFVKQYNEINKEIKELFSEKEGLQAVGQFLIKTTISKSFRIDTKAIPKDIAEKYTPFDNNGIKITLNPKVQFGQPLVGNTGYSADVLYQSYLAEDSVQGVEDEFGVNKDEVETAILYMQSLAA